MTHTRRQQHPSRESGNARDDRSVVRDVADRHDVASDSVTSDSVSSDNVSSDNVSSDNVSSDNVSSDNVSSDNVTSRNTAPSDAARRPHTHARSVVAPAAAAARWALAVAACLWIALCVAVGPIYWADDSIADFGPLNWLYGLIAFGIALGIIIASVRWARGIPIFGWASGPDGLRVRRIMPERVRQTTMRIAVSPFGSALRTAGRLWVRATDRWWKIVLIVFIGWLWVPTTLVTAFGADIRSQAREFSWAWNQWTGIKQPYIGFFSFVPMDIYPTAHYIWPADPTYLTDQHNIILTVFYGAVLAVSRYFTESNDPGFVVLSALQFLFAVFCVSATMHRFFNLPWLGFGSRAEAAADFADPQRRAMTLGGPHDPLHPERGESRCWWRTHGRVLPTGAAGWFARLTIMLFFMLCPLVVFSTISLTKSPLFAFAFVWAFGVWYELLRTQRDKPDAVLHLRGRSLAAMTVASVVMLASAKYAWYILLFEIVLALFADRRRWGVYAVSLLLPVVILHGGVVMLTASGAIIGGDPIESHGVQLQQIARIAKRNPQSIPLTAREEISSIFNLDQMADAYFPQDADPVKSSGIQSKKVSYRWRSVTAADMRRFNDAWWSIVKADPITAIDALLAKCFGYFNPTDQPYVAMDYYVTNDYVQEQTDQIKNWCRQWRAAIGGGAHQFGEIPVVGWVTHGNLYVTLMLLTGAAEVVLRRWRTLAVHLPMLLFMGVMITAPANNFERHMLPVAFTFGFVLLTFWRESQAERRAAAAAWMPEGRSAATLARGGVQ
ncbi:DUF6020 family protein [Bifidobacterium leontopitheci]|nr:DUF6020 family protein [Bifidobacterium leontopitheci]